MWREKEDNVVGFVKRDEILLKAAEDKDQESIAGLVQKIPVVPASVSVANLFETLLGRREHLAVLVDEWGGVEGIATMEDVVETLLGMEIMDDTDAVQDMRALARLKWKVRASGMGIVAPDSEPPQG